MSQINVGKINTTVGVQLPSFDTANLPEIGIAEGFMAYDTTAKEVKYYDGTKWRSLTDVGEINADGGTKYKFGNYTIHKFTTSNTFTVTNTTPGKTMDVLLVGGGGGGGAADGNCSNGGGGAGGLIYAEGVEMTVGSFPVIIGQGGTGYSNTDTQGDNGGDTTFKGYTALGGGGGGAGGAADGGRGRSGGSGGGGGHPYSGPKSSGLQPSSLSGGFGNGGGAGNNSSPQWGGGGGGGAGAAGVDGTANTGGAGGDGKPYDIDGIVKYYAGGGAGALCGNSGVMLGGLGGGGNSASFNAFDSSSGPGYNGGHGLGGGGGGGGYNPAYRSYGGDGGDGCVIIRYTEGSLDPTIGQSSENPAVNALHVLVENPSATDGLYWIKPEGYAGVAQQIWCDMSNGGWMLVASSNAADSTIPGGTSRNNANYYLNRSGVLGTPNPDSDYIIGSMVNSLNWQNVRVRAFGRGSTNGTYTWSNLGTYINCEWIVNGGGADRLVDVQPRSRITITGNSGLSGSAAYFTPDGVQRDAGFNANANQSTIGGVGTQGQYGDPSSGCYLGHGTGEGSFEGWYDGGNSAADCQGYTTWVK